MKASAMWPTFTDAQSVTCSYSSSFQSEGV